MENSSSNRTSAQTESNGTVGVQQLIDRLKSEGVEEGKQHAEALLIAAKQEAAAVVDAARAEADTILRAAQRDAKRTEVNGTRALTLASRDASLQLKEHLEHEFRGWIGGLVQEQLAAPDFLPLVIREMAAQCSDVLGEATGEQETSPAGKIKILVAQTESEDNPSARELKAFVESQAGTMFRQGVTVQLDPSVQHGFRMRIAGKNIEIDMTDEAVTAALMRFLAPKFRQLIGSPSPDTTSE